MADKPTPVDFNSASKLVAMTEKGRREMTEYKAFMKVVAEQRRLAYNAYLEKGFNPQQALELCKF